MTGARDDLVRAALEVSGAAAAVLMDLFRRQGHLSREVAECVPQAWDFCGRPMSVLSREAWVALFREAGYTHEHQPAVAPTRALRLFRGSDGAGAEGLCWSSSVDVARWFAIRADEGWVWSALVEPSRLLAFMAETYEDQYVVDTIGLDAVVLEGPAEVAAIDRELLALRLEALVEERSR